MGTDHRGGGGGGGGGGLLQEMECLPHSQAGAQKMPHIYVLLCPLLSTKAHTSVTAPQCEIDGNIKSCDDYASS